MWAVGALAFYALLQLLWPAPPGVLVQGMVVGGLTALIAFGISLIYRANRIVNFAQGDLGAAPAAFAVLLIVGPGWPFPLAVLAGIVAAVALGALLERLVIRRFFRAPRLILTVATIGLAQILAGVGVVLPRAFDLTVPPQSYPSPFDFGITIHPITFSGNDLLAMLVIPAAIVGLVAFLRYTSMGIAVRASADSADRATLLGIPVQRVHLVVWVVAAVLSTVALILRAGIIGLPIGQVLGPGVLLRALAACVIGRMERLGVIFVAAVALGVVEMSIVWDTGRSVLVDPILFVVVLGALLLQRRQVMSRVQAAAASTWQAAKEVRPVPTELAHLPEVRTARRLVLAALGAVLLVLPLVLNEAHTNLAAAVFIFGIVAVSLVVLTGWAGQISLGQVAFLGIGAAVGGYVTSVWGVDLSLAVVAAGLAGMVAAVLIGIPALHIRGLYLAVTTLAFALFTSSFLLNPDFMGWLPGGRIHRNPLFGRIAIDTDTRYYYLCLLALGLTILAVRGIRRSRTGRALIGTRENELASQSYGIDAVRAKLTAFAISGFIAAAAGALFVHHQETLGRSAYMPEESLRVFTMVVIGGLGSIPGALLGATFVQSLDWFRGLFPAGLRPLVAFLGSGAGLLVVLMVAPSGLGGGLYWIRDRFLRAVATRRGLLVPSLVADQRDDGEPPPAVLTGAGPSGGDSRVGGSGHTGEGP